MSYEFDKLFVACVTPYKPGTEDIDREACRSLYRYWANPKWLEAGGAIIVSPEAGESFYTTIEEKCTLAEIALEELGDKTLVVSGSMQPTTKALVEEVKALKRVGVKGLFLTPPMGAMDVTSSWNPIEYPEVWTDQLKAICDAVDLPIITHPTGGMYRGMPVPAMVKILDAVPNIVGWKMITMDWREVAKALREYESKRHVGILMAGATTFHDALAYGYFDGTVSGFWNYAMEPTLEFVQAWRKDNDVKKARQILFDGLIQLHDSISRDDSFHGFRLHGAYKVATWLRGLISDPFMRAPMRRLKVEEVRMLRDRLLACHLDVISDETIRKAYPNY